MKVWSNEYGEKLQPGPWKDEPDKAQWVDEATGLDCLILRAPLGHLCGYVGVPPDHPWHGFDYSQCVEQCGELWCSHSPASQIEVHGGVTYAAACQEGDDPSQGICHVPEPGRPDDVWWFGFDCAHLGDLSPGMAKYAHRSYNRDEYKTFGYVKSEIAVLSAQLVEVLGD